MTNSWQFLVPGSCWGTWVPSCTDAFRFRLFIHFNYNVMYNCIEKRLPTVLKVRLVWTEPWCSEKGSKSWTWMLKICLKLMIPIKTKVWYRKFFLAYLKKKWYPFRLFHSEWFIFFFCWRLFKPQNYAGKKNVILNFLARKKF